MPLPAPQPGNQCPEEVPSEDTASLGSLRGWAGWVLAPLADAPYFRVYGSTYHVRTQHADVGKNCVRRRSWKRRQSRGGAGRSFQGEEQLRAEPSGAGEEWSGADRDGAVGLGNPWRVGGDRQCPFESLDIGVQSRPQQSARVAVAAPSVVSDLIGPSEWTSDDREAERGRSLWAESCISGLNAQASSPPPGRPGTAGQVLRYSLALAFLQKPEEAGMLALRMVTSCVLTPQNLLLAVSNHEGRFPERWAAAGAPPESCLKQENLPSEPETFDMWLLVGNSYDGAAGRRSLLQSDV
nr:uncharacterized protein LOC105106551 [Camelus dromedarius]